MSQKKAKKQRKLEKYNSPDIAREKGISFSIKNILKQNWKFLLSLSLGVFLVYFNSLQGDFVSDDYASIPQNQLIKDFNNGASGLITGLSNWVIAVLFDINNSLPFHSLNLIIYIGILVLAFIFVSLLFNNGIAKYTTIIFAFLPIHVEGISWISGKPYLFNTFFVLSSLIFFVSYLKTNRIKYLWFLLILLPLMFLAERVRSTAFVLLAGLYFFMSNSDFKKKLSYKVYFLFLLGVISVVILMWPIILNRIDSVNSGYNTTESIFYNPFFQYPTAIPKYLQLLFVPTDLTLYHTIYILPGWLNWVIFSLYISSLIYFYLKNKNIFFALAFIFLAAAPSMAPIKVSWLVAERYMFLGSLGFSLFLVLALEPLYKKYKNLTKLLFLVLIFIYSARIVVRNIDWQTNHNLWVNTVQVSPNSHNAWNNIGDDYDKLGQYENAVNGFTQSTIVKTNYADAFHNRANILYKMGRLDLARDSYETALKFSPQLFQTYMSLIQIDLMEKNADLALKHAQKLVQIQPNNPQSAYVLGVVYAQVGMIDESKKVMGELVKLYPDFQMAKQFLIQLNAK